MIQVYQSADALPPEWDDVAGDNIYLTREFLTFMEGADDTVKKYYGVFCEGKLDTVFETIERDDFNLGMFTKRNFFIKITLVYVPLSVTRPGIAYGKCLNEALAYIRKIKGFKLLLNLPDLQAEGYAKGFTCPQCVLDVKWNTFDEYMQSLRSNYRYRFGKAMKKAAPLTIRYLNSTEEFTPAMYKLYESTYNKSRIRVEKLTERFFQWEKFVLFVAEEKGVPRGFVQLLQHGDELVFEFVGLDYTVNSQYDTYLAMLMEIIRYGIEHRVKTIDFGQTADDTKLKLGCRYEYLYAYLHHSNRLINAICKKAAPKISCKPLTEKFSVFRSDTLSSNR